MDTLTLMLLASLPALVIIAGLKDLTSMTIPNWISLILIGAFFPTALAVGLPLSTVAAHVGVAILALFVGAGMFALRWIGGGDAKLAAATTLWLGFGMTLPYLAYTAILGGVLTLAILLLRRAPMPGMVASVPWLARLLDRKQGIPYGVAMALAGLLTYSNTVIFERLAA